MPRSVRYMNYGIGVGFSTMSLAVSCNLIRLMWKGTFRSAASAAFRHNKYVCRVWFDVGEVYWKPDPNTPNHPNVKLLLISIPITYQLPVVSNSFRRLLDKTGTIIKTIR